MEFICTPRKLQIYVNSAKKTRGQIKDETGCTAIINGGLYDLSTFKPACHLKVDGQVLAADQYTYFGFGWNTTDIQCISNYTNFKNFICCVCMVKDGQAVPMYYDANVGRACERTALGIMPDGKIWAFVTKQKLTPVDLQQVALNVGCKHALMLDGGASVQCTTPTETILSTRRVHNYICIWDYDDMKPEERTLVYNTLQEVYQNEPWAYEATKYCLDNKLILNAPNKLDLSYYDLRHFYSLYKSRG